MYFLAFLFFVWLLLAGLAYAAWMLRDAWKKGRSTTGPSHWPWFSRLCPTKEVASQVLVALGVCAVVGYALQSILRDESFQTARDLTVSWVALYDPDEPPDEKSDGRIPDRLLYRYSLQPGRPVYAADLGGLPITDEDLQWMTQEYPDMEVVILSGTKLTDDGLRSLSRLKNLQMLTLDRTQLTDAGLAHLVALTNLRSLSLDGCQISDAGLRRLAALTNLRNLRLRDCRISDAGIAHLSLLGNLRELSLRGTQVTDVGLASLTSMTELQELDLIGTAVTEAGLRHLENLPDLRHVDLEETAVPSEARARFRDR